MLFSRHCPALHLPATERKEAQHAVMKVTARPPLLAERSTSMASRGLLPAAGGRHLLMLRGGVPVHRHGAGHGQGGCRGGRGRAR